MVQNSKIRKLYPYVSFFFACLGASFGSSSARCFPIEGFVSRNSGLGFMLADLYPLLHQSLNWFREMVGEREGIYEVRSSKLEMGLSSSDDPIEVEGDTATFGLSSSRQRENRPFHALKEECALDTDTLFRFRDIFQFPEEVRIQLPHEGEKAYTFSPREVCFYDVAC